MWLLLWIHILNGELEYFQIGTYTSEEACNAQKANAKVLVKNKNAAISCIRVEANKK